LNFKRLFAGGAILWLGVLFYIVERSPANIYFLNILPVHFSFYQSLPPLISFGPLSNALPAFIHILGFIILSSSLITVNTPRDLLWICLAWLFIAWGFEIGQNYPGAIVPYIPDWFENFLFLENFESYFISGTFDIYDLVAAGAGAAVAYAVLLITKEKETERQ